MSDPDRTTQQYSAGPGAAPEAELIRGYRIVSRLGEGGMGEVFRAVQSVPFERVVALKVVRRGLTSKEAIARLEAERQVLALMSHPCIASVFDAGVTEDGRPFFAMELVSGVPITEFCDARRLGVDDRIRLFLKVCEAVQHAHQKGIIHRDIKPSNVLVREEGGVAHPKLIDFGVAKVTGWSPGQGHRTQVGQIIGTPEYMSPEQAAGGASDVDVRSDVYALGVLLYELLVGARPFSDGDAPRDVDDLLQRLRTSDPPLASTRIAGRRDPTSIARDRAASPSGLRARLRGDLDWITGKALQRERSLRYQSVSELAADLERSLAGRPVLAGPPSTVYVLRKFIRRHQLLTASALAALLVLAVAGVVLARQARVLEAERNRAQREAATARQVTDFLLDVFRAADPWGGRGERVTAQELLAAGSQRVRTGLADQPEARVRVMTAIGKAYDGLALYGPAQEVLEAALADARALGASAAPLVAGVQVELASVRRHRGDLAKAEELLDQAVATFEKDPRLPREHAKALGDLGELLWERTEYARARATLEKALPLAGAAVGRESREVAIILGDLALAVRDGGDNPRALELFQQSRAILEKAQGPGSADVANVLANIGWTLRTMYRVPESVDYYERAVVAAEGALGAGHPKVAILKVELGFTRGLAGNPGGARRAMQEALQVLGETLGVHEDTKRALFYLGMLECDHADYGPGVAHLRQALEMGRSLNGEDAPLFAFEAVRLAPGLLHAGRDREALALYERYGERAIEYRKGKSDLGPLLVYYADARCATGPDARGLDLARKALGALDPSFPPWAGKLTRSVEAVCDPDPARLAENEAALADALRTIEEGQGRLHFRTRDLLRRSATFHRHWKRGPQAARFQRELEARNAEARKAFLGQGT